MNLISSMGGCASTSLISWFSKRLTCNCVLNSEGIGRAGPGSNPRGFKHRITPPKNDDKYLLKQNSFFRDDLNYEKIESALFLYDDPKNVVPSLFNRKIAMGHAMAITGKKPDHSNKLDNFIEQNEDSFGFYTQYENWTSPNVKRDYKRMIVKFSKLWENLDLVFKFLEIDEKHLSAFPPKRERNSSFDKLSKDQQAGIKKIYGELSNIMQNQGDIIII
jgi:hypothetical protein